jgi:hypothetical protein
MAAGRLLPDPLVTWQRLLHSAGAPVNWENCSTKVDIWSDDARPGKDTYSITGTTRDLGSWLEKVYDED